MSIYCPLSFLDTTISINASAANLYMKKWRQYRLSIDCCGRKHRKMGSLHLTNTSNQQTVIINNQKNI